MSKYWKKQSFLIKVKARSVYHGTLFHRAARMLKNLGWDKSKWWTKSTPPPDRNRPNLSGKKWWVPLRSSGTKCETKSKWFFQDEVSSKNRTNKFTFTTIIPQVDLFSSVFRKKLKTPKRHFDFDWPLYNARHFLLLVTCKKESI